MSTIVKCDRCGFTSGNIKDLIHVRLHLLESYESYKTKTEDHFELCKKCYDEIFDFRNSNEVGEDEKD